MRSTPRSRANRMLAVTALTVGLTACASSSDQAGPAVEPPTSNQPGPDTTTTSSTVAVAPDDTEVPASTTPPPESTSTVPPVLVSTTMDTAPPIDGLNGWPARPVDAEPTPVTPMLPTSAIPPHEHLYRLEFGESINGPYDYAQAWLSDDGSSYLFVTTNLRAGYPGTSPDFQTPVDTSGWSSQWDSAFTARTDPAYINLNLVDSSSVGFVQVRSRGLAVADVLQAASSLRRKSDTEPGWVTSLLPPDLRFYGEGGIRPAAFLQLLWSNGSGRHVAELRLSTESIEDLELGWPPEATGEAVDINGAFGTLTAYDDLVNIRWVTVDGTHVTVGYRGTTAAAVEFARSIGVVGNDELLAQTEVPSAEFQSSCQSLFC